MLRREYYFALTVLIALTIWLYAARLRLHAEVIHLRAPFEVQIVTSLYIFLFTVKCTWPAISACRIYFGHLHSAKRYFIIF
jgi:hypothetical protein